MNSAAPKSRIPLIDIARGCALVAMVIYHFTWDLEFFGWILPGTASEFGWRLFARCIAASFLFLVGVSLVLAHAKTVHWRSFWKRFALVAGAAALISVATYFAVPNGFIFFGILHAIALFSVISILTVRFPWWINALLAASVLITAEPLRHEVFSSPWLYWLGLAPTNPVSNDYVPLFPWLSATLFGISLAQFATYRGLFESIRGKAEGHLIDKTLGFLGRHSLIFYLIHQPILIGLIWTFTQIAGPIDQGPAFLSNCERTCTVKRDTDYCSRFCSCMLDELKAEKLFTPFLQGKVDLQTDPKANSMLRYCSTQ